MTVRFFCSKKKIIHVYMPVCVYVEVCRGPCMSSSITLHPLTVSLLEPQALGHPVHPQASLTFLSLPSLKSGLQEFIGMLRVYMDAEVWILALIIVKKAHLTAELSLQLLECHFNNVLKSSVGFCLWDENVLLNWASASLAQVGCVHCIKLLAHHFQHFQVYFKF